MNGVCEVGLSHETARVEVRERFALDEGQRRKVASAVLAIDEVAESLVLSTCNRTEVYAAGRPGSEDPLPAERIRDLLLEVGSGSGATAEDFRIRHGEAAALHALSVTAGLDSMVLGETQILGQVRSAFEEAVANGTAGPSLRHLFPIAFRLAKRAHTETAISEGQASVGSIAVELAAKVFDDLERRSVLLLGAGDAGETIALALHARRVARLLVAGRGEARAAKLAERCGGVGVSLDDAMERIGEVDIVLTAAASQDGAYLVTRGTVDRAIAARTESLLIVDTGVPRNVEPAVRGIPDVFLYDLDDLQAVAEQTRKRRRQEIRKVEAILGEGVTSFSSWWLASRGVAPLLRDLHARFDATRRKELDRLLAQVPKEHHDALERFSESLLDKLLQAPTIELRRGGEGLGDRLDLVRRLFGIHRKDESETGDDGDENGTGGKP